MARLFLKMHPKAQAPKQLFRNQFRETFLLVRTHINIIYLPSCKCVIFFAILGAAFCSFCLSFVFLVLQVSAVSFFLLVGHTCGLLVTYVAISLLLQTYSYSLVLHFHENALSVFSSSSSYVLLLFLLLSGSRCKHFALCCSQFMVLNCDLLHYLYSI